MISGKLAITPGEALLIINTRARFSRTTAESIALAIIDGEINFD